LHGLIDLKLNNIENARVLMAEANRCGIQTTLASLAQLVSVTRRKSAATKTSPKVKKVAKSMDVSVEILDGVIKELGDMRDFLIATVNENNSLKAKLDKFRKFFND
jgi:hypothetical protein